MPTLPASLDLNDNSRDILQSFISFWQGARTGEGLPHKKAFNPLKMGRILNETALVEITPDGEAFYRIVAEGIKNRSPIDLTGLPLFSFIPEEQHEMLEGLLKVQMAQPCGNYNQVAIRYDTGEIQMIDSLYLPLAGDDGTSFLICLFHDRDQMAWSSTRRPLEFTTGNNTFMDIGFGLPDVAA